MNCPKGVKGCIMDKTQPDIMKATQTALWEQMDKENFEMYLKKNSDYSPANILYMGVPGVLIRIWDKVCRLYSLFGIQLPNFAGIFDQRKAKIKEEMAIMLKNELDDKWKDSLYLLIDAHFDKLEQECKVDFTKFSERVPKNESIIDAFNDLELYSRIGNIGYRRKWER